MWNPLRLPLAAFGVVVDVARALAELPRMLAVLETALERLDELERLNRVLEGLTEQVALVLAEVRETRHQTADTAALEAQLERTQAELAEANRQIGHMLAAARPAEPAPTPEPAEAPEPPARRMGRFTGAFRRSSPAA